MEYSGDAFHTFMDLDSVIYLAVNGTVTSLPVFIQNILIVFWRRTKLLQESERHGGKWKMTILILGWSFSFFRRNNTVLVDQASSSQLLGRSPSVSKAGPKCIFFGLGSTFCCMTCMICIQLNNSSNAFSYQDTVWGQREDFQVSHSVVLGRLWDAAWL